MDNASEEKELDVTVTESFKSSKKYIIATVKANRIKVCNERTVFPIFLAFKVLPGNN